MNDETFDKMFKEVRTLLKKMKSGPRCPSDEILLDHVYDELSEREHQKVSEHIRGCERCRFEIIRIEADRIGWEDALDRNPDAALATASGFADLKHVGEITGRSEREIPKPPLVLSPWEEHPSCIEAGWGKFQTGPPIVQELFCQENSRAWASDSKNAALKYTYMLGDKQPVYSFEIPEDVHYQTAIIIKPGTEKIVILYQDRRIILPFYASLEFSEEDIGMNRIYLFFTPMFLEISPNEVDTSMGRFAEIISQVEANHGYIINFEVEVNKKI